MPAPYSTYCHIYKGSVACHSGSCNPTAGISIMDFVTYHEGFCTVGTAGISVMEFVTL